MGMSSHVSGVRDLDGKFAKMMQAKLACEKAGVGYPPEVKEYFITPSSPADYLAREMESVDIEAAVTEYNTDAVSGFEVDLSKLPEGVKAIRFENSF